MIEHLEREFILMHLHTHKLKVIKSFSLFQNRKGDPLFFKGYLAGVLVHVDNVRKLTKYPRTTKGDPPDAIILHQVD